MANLELDPVLGGREQEHVLVLKGVVVVTIACFYPAQLRQFISRSADSHFADFVRPQGHDEKVVPVPGPETEAVKQEPRSARAGRERLPESNLSGGKGVGRRIIRVRLAQVAGERDDRVVVERRDPVLVDRLLLRRDQWFFGFRGR